MYLHATTAHNSSLRYCTPSCAAWPEKVCVGGGGGEDLIFNLRWIFISGCAVCSVIHMYG